MTEEDGIYVIPTQNRIDELLFFETIRDFTSLKFCVINYLTFIIPFF